MTIGSVLGNIAADLGADVFSWEGLTVTPKQLIAGAQSIYGDASPLVGALRKKDWGTVVDLGIEDAAELVGILDPALAPVAGPLAKIIIFARHHPAGTLSAAMMKVTGDDGHAGANISTGG